MYACPLQYYNTSCIEVNTFGSLNGQFFNLSVLAVDQMLTYDSRYGKDTLVLYLSDMQTMYLIESQIGSNFYQKMI